MKGLNQRVNPFFVVRCIISTLAKNNPKSKTKKFLPSPNLLNKINKPHSCRAYSNNNAT